ncbi:MAG: hypothetical protein R3D29_13950 [Nitratireductor sp.]
MSARYRKSAEFSAVTYPELIMTRNITILGAFVACTFAAPAMAQESFSMGLWGDMPYAKSGDAPHIPALLADINASNIEFRCMTATSRMVHPNVSTRSTPTR